MASAPGADNSWQDTIFTGGERDLIGWIRHEKKESNRVGV